MSTFFWTLTALFFHYHATEVVRIPAPQLFFPALRSSAAENNLIVQTRIEIWDTLFFCLFTGVPERFFSSFSFEILFHGMEEGEGKGNALLRIFRTREKLFFLPPFFPSFVLQKKIFHALETTTDIYGRLGKQRSMTYMRPYFYLYLPDGSKLWSWPWLVLSTAFVSNQIEST